MSGNQLSLILLPTNKCNVACADVWFERSYAASEAWTNRRVAQPLQVRGHALNGVNTL